MKRIALVFAWVTCGFFLGVVVGHLPSARAQYGQTRQVYISKDDSPGFGSGSVPTNVPGSQVVGFSCVSAGKDGEDQTCFIASMK
jgi:hypothetical protein